MGSASPSPCSLPLYGFLLSGRGVEMPLPSRMHLAFEVLGYVVVVSCPEGFVQGCETRNFDIRN